MATVADDPRSTDTAKAPHAAPDKGDVHPLLTAVLVFVTVVAAVVSSLGAPLIPLISTDLHVPLSDAQWSLTAALVASAIAAPIMGRLGDGPRRRETLLAGLGVVLAGNVIAALAPNLGILVAGRAMQGVGLGLVPLTMAAARDHLPTHKVGPTIALLSVTTAAGVGLGYPISALVAQNLDLHAAFWFGALVSGVALASVFAVVPSSRHARPLPLDLVGVALIALGLVALLVGISEGAAWGWGSPKTLGLFAAAVVLLGGWIVQQLRAEHPLVDLRLLRNRTVLTADVAALIIAVAMYMYLTLIAEFVQTPHSAGYGFGDSVVVAGFALVPFSVFSLVANRTVPWFAARFGMRAVLPVGSLAVAAAGAFFALVHTSAWQAFVVMGILGCGMGYTFAAIPSLIVRAVPDRETGSAMGFYQVVRYIGFSLGSALAASILAGHTPHGAHLPTLSGYTEALWVAAAVCTLAAISSWVLPQRGSEAKAVEAEPVGAADR